MVSRRTVRWFSPMPFSTGKVVKKWVIHGALSGVDMLRMTSSRVDVVLLVPKGRQQEITKMFTTQDGKRTTVDSNLGILRHKFS